MAQSIALNGDDFEYNDLPDYKIVVREFKSGIVEMIQRLVNIPDELRTSRSHGVRFSSNLTEEERLQRQIENKEENLKRAERRARQKVKHIVYSINADHLLTLTTRENIDDSELFDSIFKKFVRYVREGYTFGGVTMGGLDGWEYVAVKEFQDRGALHMHLAVHGKQPINFLRACWYMALGGSPVDTGENTKGQVDIRYRKKRFKGVSPLHSAMQLTAYLTKYISKTFNHERDLGTHRYKASRGIEKPTVTMQYLGAFASKHMQDSFSIAARHSLGIADLMGVQDIQTWCSQDLTIFKITGFSQWHK